MWRDRTKAEKKRRLDNKQVKKKTKAGLKRMSIGFTREKPVIIIPTAGKCCCVRSNNEILSAV